MLRRSIHVASGLGTREAEEAGRLFTLLDGRADRDRRPPEVQRRRAEINRGSTASEYRRARARDGGENTAVARRMLFFSSFPRNRADERSPDRSRSALPCHGPKREATKRATGDGREERRGKKQHRRSRSPCSSGSRRSDISRFLTDGGKRERERESARGGVRRDGRTDGTGRDETRRDEATGNNTFSRGNIYAARNIMAPDLPYIDTARLTFPESHCPVRVGRHFHTYIYDASRRRIFGAATMYKRTPTRVPLDGTEATLVDTSWPVNKDHKISNPAVPIGRPRSRGPGARRPIGRPPRGCEDVLNDAPQCTWLTKADLPRGSRWTRDGRERARRPSPTVPVGDADPGGGGWAPPGSTRTTRAATRACTRLPNLPHSKNGRTQNNTARAE